MVVFAHFGVVCAKNNLKFSCVSLQFMIFIIFLWQTIFNLLKNYNYVRN